MDIIFLMGTRNAAVLGQWDVHQVIDDQHDLRVLCNELKGYISRPMVSLDIMGTELGRLCKKVDLSHFQALATSCQWNACSSSN